MGTTTFAAVANKCEMKERRIKIHVDFRQAGIGFAGKIVRTYDSARILYLWL